ncbi:hypothetical protein ACOSP7_015459 [Xanthoceras sorbifolium]|uniref:CUE domain-containing protein n=1 Tax=Xanthoceras sorbifolium TaxID=99658 RepID=A0ABQ8I6T3_9ROSI|nr:hypothetical protein JRO89_XS04G0239100 [Xanthoceras sorbifolium]
MKQGKSSLNPDAASYIPLHMQLEANGRNKVSVLTTKDSLTSGDENARFISPSHGHCGTEKYFQAGASDSDVHGIEGHLIGSEILLEGHENLSDRTGEQYMDENSEKDLDFLAGLFPEISEQSLTDVYAVNGGDLGASIDMLIQLEDDVPEDLLHVA